jgi:hypothetical protein
MYRLLQRKGPLKGGQVIEIGGGSVAPTPFGLKTNAWPIRLMASAVAIDAAIATISDATVSDARTMPAVTVSAVGAALVEAWTIPAICVKANRDVLDRRKRFDR